jgi:signal peptidase
LKRKSGKNGLLRAVKKESKTLFLLAITILSVVVVWRAFVFVLRTEYPFQTPTSDSMVPTLRVGDLLIVQGGLNASDLCAHPGDGDIIVFRDPRNPNNLVVHRAIEKSQIGNKWYFKTKGDNNNGPDPWQVPEDNLVGKVIFGVPLLGYVKIVLGTPTGIAACILSLAFLFFIENIVMSDRKGKNSKRAKNE